MSIADLGLLHWIALLQHELLLFAAVFFLLGAIDDIAVDAIWLWLKAAGQAKTLRRSRAALQHRPLADPVAVLIPAWREAAVIGDTIAHLLSNWPQTGVRLYVGCYRNDPATLAAALPAPCSMTPKTWLIPPHSVCWMKRSLPGLISCSFR